MTPHFLFPLSLSVLLSLIPNVEIFSHPGRKIGLKRGRNRSRKTIGSRVTNVSKTTFLLFGDESDDDRIRRNARNGIRDHTIFLIFSSFFLSHLLLSSFFLSLSLWMKNLGEKKKVKI